MNYKKSAIKEVYDWALIVAFISKAYAVTNSN